MPALFDVGLCLQKHQAAYCKAVCFEATLVCQNGPAAHNDTLAVGSLQFAIAGSVLLIVYWLSQTKDSAMKDRITPFHFSCSLLS